MRTRAHYFRVLGRDGENRGLAGGERGIRTPETLQDSGVGIQTERGALFSRKKINRAGEILFA